MHLCIISILNKILIIILVIYSNIDIILTYYICSMYYTLYIYIIYNDFRISLEIINII